MSFPNFNPTEILDETVAAIIVQQVTSRERLPNHPLSQRRLNRCRVLAAGVSNISSNITLDFGSYFAPSPLPMSECVVWKAGSQQAPRNQTMRTVSTDSNKSNFSSALSVLRQRKQTGNVEASEAFNSIERDVKIRKTDERPELFIKKPANEPHFSTPEEGSCDREAVVQLAHRLGSEIKPDILSLVLNNRVQEHDISGLSRVRKLIREKIINPIKRPDLHFGLHQPPHGILLFGAPGTGKTLLAKWIAAESGAAFFEVSPSNLISKYYGETESITHTLFAVAAHFSPSVIFIDESDSLLSKRRPHDDESTIRMKNQLLQMMDGVRSQQQAMVVVIAATNRPDMLDEAALRRLSKRVFIPLPELEAREGQIRSLLTKHHTKMTQRPVDSTTSAMDSTMMDVDSDIGLSQNEVHAIAELTEGWNGSDLKNLCSKAADASYEEAVKQYGGIEQVPNTTAFRSIQYSDFIEALKEVRPSSKLLNAERGSGDLQEWEQKFGCL